MDKAEKAMELLERAAKFGLVVEFRDGLNLLKNAAGVDPEVIEELTKYLPEIRGISQRRAIAALAHRHVGSRIFSKEHGPGWLVGASNDGTLTLRIGAEMRRSDEEESRLLRMSIMANAENVLIVDENGTEETSSPADTKVGLEHPRKRLFGLI